MERTVVLKDSRVVQIRPIRPEDAEASLGFFAGLGEDELRYMRRDVLQQEIVEERIRETASGLVDRVVALHEDRIVADGSLERERYRWGENVAQIRLIVAPDFRRAGLGMRIARELYVLGHQHDVARINVRAMRPQKGAIEIFHRLGFREEFVIPDHVRDRDGAWQDLVVMRCDLAVLMDEVEHAIGEQNGG